VTRPQKRLQGCNIETFKEECGVSVTSGALSQVKSGPHVGATLAARPADEPRARGRTASEKMIDAVEVWRAKQKPVPNMSEAIRRLVELGLKVKK